MPSPRSIPIAALFVCAGIALAAPQANAQGFGSFALCYERLKQLVELLGAQGQTIEETVDEPREKLYVVVTRFGDTRRTMSCSPKGDLMVLDE